MPKISAGWYLIEALHELPAYKMVDGQEKPQDWVDLVSFNHASGSIYESWELKVLRSLSIEYMRGKVIGTNPLGIAPIDDK